MTAGMIDQAICKRCGRCASVCPVPVIRKDSTGNFGFDPERAHLCIHCAQCMAVCPEKAVSAEGLSYGHDLFELDSCLADADSLRRIIAGRRSVRVFRNKQVPDEFLEKIVEAISFAPPSFPPVKTELVVVRDRELILRALPLMIRMYEGLTRAMGNQLVRTVMRLIKGPGMFTMLKNHVVPLMAVRMPALKDGSSDTITRKAPAMVIFHARRDAENHVADAHIALSFGLLAAHALGLGASASDLVSQAIEHTRELRKLFCIPPHNEVIASMLIGYPVHTYRRGIKRSMAGVRWL